MAAIDNRLAILSHRVHAADRSPAETLTLLWEGIGLQELAVIQKIYSVFLNEVTVPYHVTEPTPTEADKSGRWGSVTFQGPGMRELLLPLTGWALITARRDGIAVCYAVRIELYQGVLPEAIAAREAKRRSERESATNEAKAELITLRREVEQGPLTLVATGQPIDDPWAMSATLLRSSRTEAR
jgi:hypothetical protein